MRKVLIAMFAAGGLGLFGTAASFGLPVNGSTLYLQGQGLSRSRCVRW